MAERVWSWWLEQLRFRVACSMFHQPMLLREVARAVRSSAALSSMLSLAASATAVRAVLERESGFSRDHYPPVMLDGPFLIGAPSGPAHAQHSACLHGLLPSPADVARATAQALPALQQRVLSQLDKDGGFDLIDDYLMPLVWSGLRPAYGEPAAERLQADRTLFDAARWLGAQLMIGSVATPAVRLRALRSAALLGAAFGRADPLLGAQWPRCLPDAHARQRNAIGLMWVGHPATTQGGALLMQELLARAEVYRQLRDDSGAGGADAASAPAFRDRLRDHVLELLRFRPPFPILARQTPRQGWIALDGERAAPARPGSMIALAIGALHDPAAQREDPGQYVPGRHFHHADDRTLMFGSGDRRCIARDQVIEILITALAGLIGLDPTGQSRPLRYAKAWPRRIVYDGPVIAHMRLRF